MYKRRFTLNNIDILTHVLPISGWIMFDITSVIEYLLSVILFFKTKH
jgi:hypothetical protein